MRKAINPIIYLLLISYIFISCGKPKENNENTAPIGVFTVIPTSGKTTTTFKVDGSNSVDAEDAAEVLEVRWDWESDGIWDINWTKEKTATHCYGTVGTYKIKMEVKDTKGLIGTDIKQVIVTKDNTPPIADFRITPSSGDINTIFQFDASYSKDEEDSLSLLEVRWDWESDGIWDTQFTKTKTASHKYTTGGLIQVTLEVKDTRGLKGSISKEIDINDPPQPEFVVNPRSGISNTTLFTFDASLSKDKKDSTDKLQVRWDFNGDGTWDTSFSTDKLATYLYNSPGEFNIKLEVKDTGGLTTSIQKKLLVDTPWLWCIAIINDTHEVLPKLFEYLTQINPEFIIHIGDSNFGGGADKPSLSDVLTLMNSKKPPLNLHMALGNHDVEKGLQYKICKAAVEGIYELSTGGTITGPIWNQEVTNLEGWKTGNGPYRYSFKKGGIRFILLDPLLKDTDYVENKNWIQNLLTQPDDSSISIVFEHMNDFTGLSSLFEGINHNIKLCLMGHGHRWRREDIGGIPFIEFTGNAWLREGTPENPKIQDVHRILVYPDKIVLDKLPMNQYEQEPGMWTRILTISGNFTK